MGRFKDVLIHSIERATGTLQLYIGMNQKVKHHRENNVDLQKYFQWLFTRIHITLHLRFFKATRLSLFKNKLYFGFC